MRTMISDLFPRRAYLAAWLLATTFALAGCSAAPLPPVTAVPAVAVAAPATAKPAFSASTSAALCAQDAEIEATKRAAIGQAGIRFMDVLLGQDPSAAFDLFSKVGQTEITRPRLVEMAAGFHTLLEPKGIAVDHTYLIRLNGPTPERVVCARDLASADGWSSVKVTSTPEQAYVLATAEAKNEKLAITIWLVPEAREWKVQAFSIYDSTLGRRESAQLLELARKQTSLSHDLNAWLLYFAAAATVDRGPFLQLGSQQARSDAYFQAKRPVEMSGTAPWDWKHERETFKILRVGGLGIAGKMYVVLDHVVPPRTSREEMERVNRALIAHFKQRHPEYSEVFAGLLARAHEQGTNNGFGTVDEGAKEI